MAPAQKVTPNLDRARRCWAPKVPDWITVLAVQCDASSQGKVAQRLGVSGAVVNQLLGNSYKGRVESMEARVRGEFMNETVTCPVLGEISTRDCIANQTIKFRPTNDLRVRLRKTCPICPNREAK
jgi:hypothetical protein